MSGDVTGFFYEKGDTPTIWVQWDTGGWHLLAAGGLLYDRQTAFCGEELFGASGATIADVRPSLRGSDECPKCQSIINEGQLDAAVAAIHAARRPSGIEP